ncbi:MAG: tetratricopeptide repeat protein [Bacteroidota bacterium]
MSLSLDHFTILIDCTWTQPDSVYLERLENAGARVELIIPSDREDEFPSITHSQRYYSVPADRLDSYVDIISDTQREWVLLLRGQESFSIDEWENTDAEITSSTKFIEAIIHIKPEKSSPVHHRFEIRAIRTDLARDQLSKFINGNLYPQFIEDDWSSVSKEAFNIRRSIPISAQINWPEFEDFELDNWDSTDLLWIGYYALEQERKDLAASIFKTLRGQYVFSHRDQPAVINGLAQVAFQNQQWDQCRSLLDQSLELNEQQQLPHLIRFNLASKQMRWEEAYQQLYTYLQVLAEGSRVNHDVVMPLDQTHKLLADTAYQGGQHERAFVHYQEVYRIQNELGTEPSPEVLERLLLYSIELDEKEKAIMYFQHLYHSELDNELNDEQWNVIDRRIQLFAGNEWFDFVVAQYERLFEHNKNRPSALRRLVAALIKNEQIERAQSLIHKYKTVIS